MLEVGADAVAVGLTFDAKTDGNIAKRIARGTTGGARARNAARAENQAAAFSHVDAVSVGQTFDASVPERVADAAIAAAVAIRQALDALPG
jgi:hypothetical protein